MPFEIEKLLDNHSFNSIIFYPRRSPKPSNDGEKYKILEFEIANGEKNIKIGGFFHFRSYKNPSVLFFHGNGEIAQDYSYFIDKFLDCGMNIAVMDYRGYGFSTGTPTFKNIIQDAMPIYNSFLKWVTDNSFSQSIFLYARSLGSIPIAEIASHNPSNVKGIIFESSICDTYKIMRSLFMINIPGFTEDAIKPWSNITRIVKIRKPVLIIHGTRDHIVPFEHGKLIFDIISENVKKEFVPIENAGHNDIQLYEEKYYPAIKDFIQKLS